MSADKLSFFRQLENKSCDCITKGIVEGYFVTDIDYNRTITSYVYFCEHKDAYVFFELRIDYDNRWPKLRKIEM